MRLTVYLLFVSFGFCVTMASFQRQASSYILLLKQVRSLYSTSAVFFALPNNNFMNIDPLVIMHSIHTWCRLLESENIITLSTTFENMHALSRYYNTIVRPLIVVPIPGPQAFDKFSQITKSLKMSFAAWFVLVYPTPANKTYSYCHRPIGNPFHLSFNSKMLVMCLGDPILREWYSVDGKSVEIFELGKWDLDRNSVNQTKKINILTNLSLYERRNDLKGIVLRGVVVTSSTLLTIEDKKVHGYFGKVISELENSLNFTIDIVAKELLYGSFNITTKLWNGAMKWVASRKVDIGVSDFTLTNNRLDYVDYTIPLLTTRMTLHLKQREFFAAKWFAYYKAFSLAVWLSILLTVIISQVVLTFIRSCMYWSRVKHTMYEEFILIWGILCQQGLPEFPQNTSLRLAYFTMTISALVISAAYSASLICFLTARIRETSFQSIEEFIKDGSYRIIVVRDSSSYDLFALSQDPLSVALMKLMKPLDELPLTEQEGLERVCNDDKLAFYTNYNSDLRKRRTNLFYEPCKTYSINFGRIDSTSLILTKNNQYTQVLSYQLQKLLSTGVLDRFKNVEKIEEVTTIQAVGFNSTISVLLIFICGVTLAFIILIIEIYYDKYKRIKHTGHSLN